MIETGTRALSRLRAVVVGVFVLALLAGIVQPLYTDEVGWRMQERAGFDGVDKMLTMICGPNTVVRPPFWMMPARYYSALFNGLFAEPIYVRISGIVYALVLTAMILKLIGRLARTANERLALSMLAAGFLSMGTMPIMLVWSRPEQPILLAFTGALLIAFADWNKGVAPAPDAGTPARTAWLRSLALVLLASVALSYHVKALFTIPIFLAGVYFASRGRTANLPRIVAAVMVIAITAWGAHYWVDRLECPYAPDVRDNFIKLNTGAALVEATGWSQIWPLLGKAIDHITLFQYLGMPAPRPDPISFWLPAGRVSLHTSFLWFLTLMVPWCIALSLSGFCIAGAPSRAWRERRLDARFVFALLLIAGILGWSASQGFRNPYEMIFVVPMAVLAVVLALAMREKGIPFGGAIEPFAVVVGLLGVGNVAMMAAIYGPVTLRATGERGYLSEQPYSVSTFGYAGLHRDVLAVARKCGITKPDGTHGIVLDDLTYFTFMRSRMPEHMNGLFLNRGEKESIDYLNSVRSPAIVASCSRLPPYLQPRAQREGQFCCIAPPSW
ncbi:MAG TPA: hypothetical protein VF481_19120 [Novosphingobium sp.]